MSGESVFWQYIRKALPKNNLHIMRVENLTNKGTPDINFCYKGVEGWIELKSKLTLPVKATTRVFGNKGLSSEQKVWLKNRFDCGGNVFVLCKAAKGIFLFVADTHNITNFNEWCEDELIRNSIWKHKGNKPDFENLMETIYESQKN